MNEHVELLDEEIGKILDKLMHGLAIKKRALCDLFVV